MFIPDRKLELPEYYHPRRKPLLSHRRINTDDPIWQSCVSMILGRRDIKNNVHASYPNTGGVEFQPEIKFTAGSVFARVEFGALDQSLTTTFTLEAHITSYTYVALATYFGAGSHDGNGSEASTEVKSIMSYNNNIYFWGASADWDTGVAWPTGEISHFCFVADGTSIELFLNGVSRGSTTVPSLSAANGNIKIGSAHASASTSGDFVFHRGAFYNRALNPAEVAKISDNPYWCFK